MKYLMISPGLCVQPTMEKPPNPSFGDRVSDDISIENWNKWQKHLDDLPKLPTTCTLPAGEWFEGREWFQVMAPTELGGQWYDCSEEHYRLCSNPERRRKFIFPASDRVPRNEKGEVIVGQFEFDHEKQEERYTSFLSGEQPVEQMMIIEQNDEVSDTTGDDFSTDDDKIK